MKLGTGPLAGRQWRSKGCRCLVSSNDHPAEIPQDLESYTCSRIQDMKYSQACQVKMVVDQAINALERAAQDGTANKASRKQLTAAYVSRP